MALQCSSDYVALMRSVRLLGLEVLRQFFIKSLKSADEEWMIREADMPLPTYLKLGLPKTFRSVNSRSERTLFCFLPCVVDMVGEVLLGLIYAMADPMHLPYSYSRRDIGVIEAC